MFDIYKLFYFVEETGLLIQEKWYKATYPQIWKRNLRKYSSEEQKQADENIFEDISGEFDPEPPKEILEIGNVPTETKDKRDYNGNPELNEEDKKKPENW